MKTVAIVTYFPFWREGTGACNRIMTLAQYLGTHTKLKIIFSGVKLPEDVKTLRNLEFQLIFLGRNRKLAPEDYISRFKALFSIYKPNVCILENLHLSGFVKGFVPKSIKLFLDAHDLMSVVGNTHNALGYKHDQLELAEELEIFNAFDKVILIQEDEYAIVREHLGENKVILAPHSVVYSKKKQRKEITNIGFIGSDYLPNTDAAKWFILNIFPLLDNKMEFHIYGKVCNHLKDYQHDHITLHGYIDSVSFVYDKMDIMVNPVRFGAGLKIKNIEALGNGMPLITTSHGAAGLTSQIDKSFLVADDTTTFLKKLQFLIEDYEKRQILGSNAHQYIKKNFSPAKCFDPLLAAINE